MKRCILALFLLVVPCNVSLGDEKQKDDKPDILRVLHFQIYDPIEDVRQAELFESRLKELRGKQDRLVVISIDCPGGNPRLVERMYKALESFQGPKIAFVDQVRYGGVYGWPCGLALACETVVFHPQAALGIKCKSSPTPIELCKGVPCTDVHPKTLGFWMSGINLTPDEEDNEKAYVETFTMVAQKKSDGKGNVEELFVVHSTKTNSSGVPVGEPSRQKKNDTPIVLVSATAEEVGIADYVNDDVQSVINEMADGKDILEVKVPLKSGLKTVITLLLKKVDELSSLDGISVLNDNRIDGHINFWRKKRTTANTIIRILENNRDLQYLLYDDLFTPIKQTPIPSVDGYHFLKYRGRDDIKDWAIRRLKAAVAAYEIKIENLRDDKKRDKSLKKNNRKYRT